MADSDGTRRFRKTQGAETIADLVRKMLRMLGEDPEPRGLAAHAGAL